MAEMAIGWQHVIVDVAKLVEIYTHCAQCVFTKGNKKMSSLLTEKDIRGSSLTVGRGDIA